MNPGTTQDENAGKTIRGRTAPMLLGALLLAQPFIGSTPDLCKDENGLNLSVLVKFRS
jgi:hypothetical protein